MGAPQTMRVTPPARLRGRIEIPGDKSITHRALMLNAAAEGEARIDRFLDAADTRSTLECMRALGAEIEQPAEDALIVRGRGRAGLHEASDVLDCGNSGTTIRLLSGLLAGFPFLSVLSGDGSCAAARWAASSSRCAPSAPASARALAARCPRW